jgi:hypothetical protein
VADETELLHNRRTAIEERIASARPKALSAVSSAKLSPNCHSNTGISIALGLECAIQHECELIQNQGHAKRTGTLKRHSMRPSKLQRQAIADPKPSTTVAAEETMLPNQE